MALHIGRSFTTHDLEDFCPCPQEPCGLVNTATIDPDCSQHSLGASKTMRQAHSAEACPGEDAMNTTTPKPEVKQHTSLSDKVYRLLLDMWMWHDALDDPFGPRLAEQVEAETLLRGYDSPFTAYHVFKEDQ